MDELKAPGKISSKQLVGQSRASVIKLHLPARINWQYVYPAKHNPFCTQVQIATDPCWMYSGVVDG